MWIPCKDQKRIVNSDNIEEICVVGNNVMACMVSDNNITLCECESQEEAYAVFNSILKNLCIVTFIKGAYYGKSTKE